MEQRVSCSLTLQLALFLLLCKFFHSLSLSFFTVLLLLLCDLCKFSLGIFTKLLFFEGNYLVLLGYLLHCGFLALIFASFFLCGFC
jgi:hypothetical protein